MADNSPDWMSFAQRSRDEGGLGLQPHQAAGLVGNLQNESGPEVTPWGPSGDNGSAWGTAQWRGDRLEALKAHAAENGLDYKTVPAQQAFMRHEFDGSENRSYKALQAATTPEEAATIVNTQYERSADRSGNRERAALKLSGSQPMANAEDIQPALSPQVPPGALQNGGQPVTPNFWDKFGQMMQDMAPGIAQDPAHAQVLEASAAAARRAQGDPGTWSHITLPNGQIARINSKQGIPQVMSPTTGQWQAANGTYAKDDAEKPKWGITGKDKYGQPVYGYPPTREEAAASKASAPAAADAPEDNAVALTGKPYIDKITTDKGTGYASQVQSIIEGRTPYPTGMLLKTPFGQQLASDVTQADPSFETGNAMSRVKVRNEFKAGGPSSPAGQITAGNTAIQHAGEMSDALEQFKGDGNDHEGVPFISYYRNKGHNASVAGTKAGAPLSDFNTARDHFAEEVTKFYSGSTGSEGERKRALDNLDAAKSLPELRSAIAKEAALMHGKVNALQERWKTGMGPLVPDYELVHPESQKAIDRINTRNTSTSAPEAKPATGSFKDVPWSYK